MRGQFTMKIIQGFVTIPALADNRVGVTAPFGEFSSHAASFSRDLRNLSNTTLYPHIEVITVKAVDESSSNIDIPQEVVNQILILSNWIVDQYNHSGIPLDGSKAVLEAAVVAELPRIKSARIGQIMSTPQQGKRLIDYIRFDVTEGTELYRMTLWFSDARFRAQYSYYEIEVIPPVDDINRLVDTLPNVAMSLASVKVQSLTSRINNQNRKDKFTELQTYPLTWHDPNDKTGKLVLNTEWTLIIYGNAGADTEAIKGAIRDYLLANSNYPNWPLIFPNLFSSNEFVVIPFWDAIATPRVTYDDGLYNSMITTGLINLATYKYIPKSYRIGAGSDEFIALNTTIGSVFYRTMMFMALGNPSNKGGVYTFEHLFPDYISISTDSPDFSRMTVNTQTFVLKLNDCFNKARNYSPNERFPEGFTLAVKGAREHIGFDFGGFTFYVMTRLGYLRDI